MVKLYPNEIRNQFIGEKGLAAENKKKHKVPTILPGTLRHTF